MNDFYKIKYSKYKRKYNNLKLYQSDGGLDFTNFPCSIYHAFNMKFNEIKSMFPTLKKKKKM